MIAERKNYKDILYKYEILQKEQIDVKSKMTAEKEKLQRYKTFKCLLLVDYMLYNFNYKCGWLKLFFSLLESKKKDLVKVEFELKSLKDKYNNSSDVWNKEKLEMQVNIPNNYDDVF